MKQKKHPRWPLIVSVAALLVLLVLAAVTVPVYPDFQREVAAPSALQRAFPQAQLPAVQTAGLCARRYALLLEGRTVFSKPDGYLIEAVEAGTGELSCSLEAWPREQTLSAVTSQYHGVSLALTDWQVHSTEACGVALQFSLDGWSYRFQADCPTQGQPDAQIQRLSECLMAIAQEMIDRKS